MLNWLKKEWRQLKDNDRHHSDVSEISKDPSENFNELVKLGERVNPRFKLSGNYQLFMIKGKSDNIMLFIGSLSAILAGLLLPSISLIMG